ncbi:MAG: tRNA pseudouridine(38-40) synthase TruA [Ndongobacter sp.]|nr:tRNA pseudouridine(38-40) synthase TruA [Ndongobacter sp.]
MKNILLRVAYDGTRFRGFQGQPEERTVQGELRRAVDKLLGRPTRLIAAGRTDTGVHAEEQWVNFLSASPIAPKGIAHHLKPLLPEDLLALSSEEVPLSFHARFSSGKKVYRYVLSLDQPLLPVYRHYKASCAYPLDVGAMRRVLPLFLGRHDFSAFSRQDPLRQPIRDVSQFTMEQSGNDLVFHIAGESFLHNQIRIIIGALVEVGRGRLTEARIARLLEEGAAQPAAPTYPACGLTLERIFLKSESAAQE